MFTINGNIKVFVAGNPGSDIVVYYFSGLRASCDSIRKHIAEMPPHVLSVGFNIGSYGSSRSMTTDPTLSSFIGAFAGIETSTTDAGIAAMARREFMDKFEELETEIAEKTNAVLNRANTMRPQNTKRVMIYHSAGYRAFHNMHDAGFFDSGTSVVQGVFLADCLYNGPINDEAIELASRRGAWRIGMFAAHISSADPPPGYRNLGSQDFNSRFRPAGGVSVSRFDRTIDSSSSHNSVPSDYAPHAIRLFTGNQASI